MDNKTEQEYWSGKVLCVPFTFIHKLSISKDMMNWHNVDGASLVRWVLISSTCPRVFSSIAAAPDHKMEMPDHVAQ